MEALAAAGGLPRAALHSQLAAALQVVLHMRRLRSGARVFDTAGVLSRNEAGEVLVRPVWTRAGGWSDDRGALGELLADRGVRAPW
jgi:pilus assembly protein CpaF